MRIRRISPDEMNADQKEVYDANLASKRGRMPAPVHAGLLGYYCLVSMTLSTFEFDLPEGETPDLA